MRDSAERRALKLMNQSTIKKVMQELGKRGGKSKSKAKGDAARKSLAKARKTRWAGKS